MTRRLATAVILLLTGAGLTAAQISQPAGYTEPVPVCELRDGRITEASGIVPSHRNPGGYYIHNDSGDRARVFLIDRTGRTRLTIRLKNAAAVDYEDIALAPGAVPGTFDVCVADIGDNRAQRPRVTIYRFPEVQWKQRGGASVEVEPVAYHVRYADGPANAEAFFVHPRNGDGYILTKRTDGSCAVYKMTTPWSAARETVLPRLLTLELPSAIPLARIVTAADVSPDGRRVALRCYLGGWEWRLPPGTGQDGFDRIFQTNPVALTLAAEQQGEALCYTADGRTILTLSEGGSPTLYELPAATPSSGPAP